MKKIDNKKLIISYIGLILMFILMGNSNNNPSPYMERIFKPITFGDSTFYYYVIIVMVVIYYCLKGINSEKENYFINSPFSRFIVTIILISGFIWLGGYGTKFYKSFSHNLNSIYMNRDGTYVEFDYEKNKLSLNGKISILNCSDEIQEFRIKIKSPSLVKKHTNEDYIVLKDKVKIYPEEKRNLHINEEFDYKLKKEDLGYSGQAFEYKIFNDENEVVFKGSINDYSIDDYSIDDMD